MLNSHSAHVADHAISYLLTFFSKNSENDYLYCVYTTAQSVRSFGQGYGKDV